MDEKIEVGYRNIGAALGKEYHLSSFSTRTRRATSALLAAGLAMSDLDCRTDGCTLRLTSL